MFFWGGNSYEHKGKTNLRDGSVLISIFLIVILFAMFLPYISSSNVTIPFKMLFELSPFIVISWACCCSMQAEKKTSIYWVGVQKKPNSKITPNCYYYFCHNDILYRHTFVMWCG